MITRTHAIKLRELIVKGSETLADEEAFYGKELYDEWVPNGYSYKKDDRRRFLNDLYKCLQNHTSQPDWAPDLAVSLWVKIDDPAIEWPEWKQPQGAHNAYPYGAKVSHNNKHWISNIDGNAFEPGVAGWDEVS